MSKPKWHPVTINVTEMQLRQLKALAGLKGLSVASFVKWLLEEHLKANEGLSRIINDQLNT